MYSMWSAPSDLDYYQPFDPDPPEEDEFDEPTAPFKLEEQWEAADPAFEESEPVWLTAPSPDGEPDYSRLDLEVA